ncbi:Phosphoglycerol transferase MdoB [Pseudomonas sp. LAIL14HWK12:I11]|nr:Phosphoglycerol transferase MdoB [Pseudomonas sp. LAIL14HWK12:I11]SMR79608.1 Phosphoglycerol transferase MdoB [Pseudomonas sp. LAIL14HWK12:I10]SOD05692.1 Phosphoglycerol transferase MdoB [Pseudomonas sp. LAIL14HWK12:I8]
MIDVSLLPVALIGLMLTVLVERLLIPRPALRRPADCWMLHVGLWCVGFGLLYALTARPLFSGVNLLLLWVLIVLVSNSKYHSLREPFVCADFEYFSDAVKFPRLYLPFFGFGKAAVLAVGFLVYLWAGLRFEVPGARVEALLPVVIGLGLLRLGHRRVVPSFDAERDVRGWGLAASLWRYFWAARAPVDQAGLGSPFACEGSVRAAGAFAGKPAPTGDGDGLGSPVSCEGSVRAAGAFAGKPAPTGNGGGVGSPVDCEGSVRAAGAFAGKAAPTGNGLADLVSVQSESFFDVRGLWPGVRAEVLGEYDVLASQALARGKLQVAAWGANTVRTEFAYLTGIPSERLGVHRFNPYRVLARRGLPSIASRLKALGYRTVCIHPYDGGFYGRNKVLPALGFDEFIDVRAFNPSQKAGPFIGDCAVAQKIRELLEAPGRTQPLFIHAVTMENHGPLHLESVAEHELPAWFDRPLQPGMQDLAPYLRHIGNADRMLGMLRETLLSQPNEALLCFFGDHVPILPEVYQAVGAPAGDTDYLIWSNRRQPGSQACPIAVHKLSSALLAHAQAPAQGQAAHSAVAGVA